MSLSRENERPDPGQGQVAWHSEEWSTGPFVIWTDAPDSGINRLVIDARVVRVRMDFRELYGFDNHDVPLLCN